jgi:hypothetical protein
MGLERLVFCGEVVSLDVSIVSSASFGVSDKVEVFLSEDIEDEFSVAVGKTGLVGSVSVWSWLVALGLSGSLRLSI